MDSGFRRNDATRMDEKPNMNNPSTIDKLAMRQAFEKAAATYDEAAALQREAGQRLFERLDFLRDFQPEIIVDLGAGTGHFTHALLQKFKKANVIAFDVAQAMLKKAKKRGTFFHRPTLLCGEIEKLPLKDKSVDLLFSNFCLQWCTDLDQACQEFQRVLKPNAILLFTTFGPDTLKELRQSWLQADNNPHVNSFADLHDIGDALLRNGLANPVMDMEIFTLHYASVRDLMRELKMLGAHNVQSARSLQLTGKSHLQVMERHYETFRCDGQLPATYEVIYGHATAHPRQSYSVPFNPKIL